MRALGVIAFLAAQVLWIVGDQFAHSHYFSWAPLEAFTRYRLEVTARPYGTMTQREACSRYRLDSCGLNPRWPAHVMDIVNQYETSYGKSDHADVKMSYTVNGGSLREWRFHGAVE